MKVYFPYIFPAFYKSKSYPAAANPAFSQAYLLQVSFTMDNDLCEDIEAEGASLADAGSNTQITFTVMPKAAAQAVNAGGNGNAAAAEAGDGETAGDGNGTAAEDRNGETAGSSNDVTELIVKASVTDFEMGDISINGAAMTNFPVSFVSERNENMGQTMFIMSAEGISIPEEEVVEVVEEDNRNFFQKLIDKILHHKED